MATHALYSPSKLHRILHCPASATAEQTKSSSYADEGTMLHDCVAKCLEAHRDGYSWVAKLERVRDTYNLTHEQKNAVEDCVVYALNLVGTSKEMLIEERFYVVDNCDGTADFSFDGLDIIHVVDWKFGQGVEVSAIENPQLKAYGIGLVKKLGKAEKLSQRVKLHVVQPRINNYSAEELTVGDLRRWVDFELVPGIAAAEQDNPEFHPSEEACRWCPRKQTCTARLEMAMNNASRVFAAHAKMPDIPLDALQVLIPMAEQIEQVIKDLKLLAQQQLSEGKEVPGYKLVRGRSNRVWFDSDEAAEFLSDYIDAEDLFSVKMIGPAAAEKLLDREMRKDERFQALVDKPEGKITLAPESDKRPGVSLDPSAVFAGCTQTD